MLCRSHMQRKKFELIPCGHNVMNIETDTQKVNSKRYKPKRISVFMYFFKVIK
jgi:hypothetical protein